MPLKPHEGRNVHMPAVLHSPTSPIPLGAAAFSIGSAPDNALLLQEAGVAPHHATIRSVGFGGRRSYSLLDQGSSPGTFVNEQRLTPQQPHLLTPGDQIRIGSTVLIYQASTASLATPPDSLPAATAVQGGEHLPSPASTGLARVTAPTFLRQRRWLLLVVLGVVLLAGVIGIARLSQPKAAGILDTYCAALTGGDYHTVYQQLSPRLQKAGSEQQVTSPRYPWTDFRQFWHYYQDSLALTLGRLGAFGALTTLDLPLPRLCSHDLSGLGTPAHGAR
jgi:hypothetical protein